MSNQQQQIFGGLTITQWVIASVALILYCLLVQFDFFNSEFLQSAFLIYELGQLQAELPLDLLAYQPIGVKLLLRSITIHPPSDVVFRAVAFLQGGATLLLALLVLARSLRFPVALAGALLFMHYTWPGSSALLPLSWAGTIFSLFAFALVDIKQPWILALSLVLSSVLCPPLLMIQIIILILWFLGEWIAQKDRPKLVRSTLNIDPPITWHHWLIVVVAMVPAIVLAWSTYGDLSFGYEQRLDEKVDLMNIQLTYLPLLNAGLELMNLVMRFPPALYLLAIGGGMLGLIQKHRLRSLALFLLSVFVSTWIYGASSFKLGTIWFSYGTDHLGILLFIPVAISIILGFADAYFNKWYVTALAVLLILAWIPVYHPTYLT